MTQIGSINPGPQVFTVVHLDFEDLTFEGEGVSCLYFIDRNYDSGCQVDALEKYLECEQGSESTH